MNIKELEKRVVTEVRNYIQAHAPIDYDGTGKTVLDAEPLVRMIEIHFSHMTSPDGDLRNMTIEQAGLWAIEQWKGAMEARKKPKGENTHE